jgi:hypothetical protein
MNWQASEFFISGYGVRFVGFVLEFIAGLRELKTPYEKPPKNN